MATGRRYLYTKTNLKTKTTEIVTTNIQSNQQIKNQKQEPQKSNQPLHEYNQLHGAALLPGAHDAAPGSTASVQLPLHAVAPDCAALNFPTGQAVHADDPAALAKVPVGQG